METADQINYIHPFRKDQILVHTNDNMIKVIQLLPNDIKTLYTLKRFKSQKY